MLVGHNSESRNESRNSITKSIKLYAEMKDEAEKYQKLAELARYDIIDTLKRSVNYCNYLFPIDNAIKWLKLRRDKIDNRKKYVEKEHFEYLSGLIVSNITGRPIEITNIEYQCYIGARYQIDFDCATKSFSLVIPSLDNLTTENFVYSDYGQMILYLRDGFHIEKTIGCGYEDSEIMGAFRKFISSTKETDDEYFNN